MNRSRCRRLSFMIASCVIATGGCAQHRIATSFAELQPRMKTGQTIYVTTVNGDVQKGTLETLSPGAARVNISGAATQVLERDTVHIAVREPLWQGAVIGAVTGALLGGTAQSAGEAYGCAFGSAADCASKNPVAGLLIGAGLGSAIGAGIDALIWKRKRIFTAPQTTRPRVVLSPMVGRRTGGLRLTATF